MFGGPGKLYKTTKPDNDYVYNGSETIEDSVVYLESQIGNQQISLNPKNVQIWEDDKGQGRWWCMRPKDW